jgi:hypothetical protein
MQPGFLPNFEFRGGLKTDELPVDRLDREPLAKQLAQSLQHQDARQSIVIGLSGEWGSGKSWLIARVRELLKADYQKGLAAEFSESEPKPPTTPHSFEFQAWQWSGTEEITKQFFDQLGESISTVEKDNRSGFWKEFLSTPLSKFIVKLWDRVGAASTSEKLAAYAAWFTAHSTVVGGYNKGFVGLLGFLALLSSAEMFKQKDWFSPLTSAVIAALTFIYGLFVLVAEILSKQADAKKKWADANDKKPRALKKALSQKLAKLPHPIIVILDDLDRLTAGEIAHVFQLVKTQADFPNIHYLLGFDRNLIAGALEKEAPGVPINGLPDKRGHDFLEKIVPVIFDLPSIDTEDLRDILCADLEAVFGLAFYDNLRWSGLWSQGLRFFFDTLRDVDRFQNSLKFNLYLLGGRGDNLDVDALDFVCVETLRLFEPEIFKKLSQSRELLTKDRALERQLQQQSSSNSQSQTDPAPSADKKVLNKICGSAIVSSEGVEMLICHLFPEMAKMLGYGVMSHIHSTAAIPSHAARVSNSTYFPRFFRYALGPDEWSAAEVTEQMVHCTNPSLFAEQFQKVANGALAPKRGQKERITLLKTEDVRAIGHWRNALELCDLVGQRIQKFEPATSPTDIENRQKTALSLLKAGMVLPVDSYYVTQQSLERETGKHAHRALRSIEDISTKEATTLNIIQHSPETFATNIQLMIQESSLHQSGIHPIGDSKQFLLLSPANLRIAQFTIAEQTLTAMEGEAVWRRPQARLYLSLVELWENQALTTRRDKMLHKMLADDEQCFWLMEGFLELGEMLPFANNRTYTGQSLLIDNPMGGARGLGHYVPTGVLETRLPALRLHLINKIAASTSPNTCPTLASSPHLFRHLLCYVSLKQYFGAKQQPPVETSVEAECADLVAQATQI